MQIQYVANGSRRTVSDGIGRTLVSRGIARELRSEEPTVVQQTSAPKVQKVEKPAKAPSDKNISPRTGMPKRKYKRRDMRPEA